MARRKGMRGVDAGKILPPLIIGGVVIYVLSQIKGLLPSNPWGTPDDVANAKYDAWWTCNSYGAFTNDFSGIISVFKSLLYKTQLTDLINEFRNLYGLDLYTYITGGLKNASLASKQMQAVVIGYINSLPSGIVS